MKHRILVLVVAAVVTLSATAQTIPIPAGATISELALGASDLAFVYTLTGTEGTFVRVGETTLGPFDAVTGMQWSADGQTNLMTAYHLGRRHAFVNGRLDATFDAQWIRQDVSPSGGGYLIHGAGSDEYIVIHNGEPITFAVPSYEIGPGEGVGPVLWGPDGIARFWFEVGGGSVLYVGTEIISKQNYVSAMDLAPDGTLLYATVSSEGRILHLGDRVLSPAGGSVRQVRWKPDGSGFAHVTGTDRQRETVWIGDQEVGTYQDVRKLSWSPNGRVLSFVHGTTGAMFLHSGNVDLGPFVEVMLSNLVWAPGGGGLAFATKGDDERITVHAADQIYGPYPSMRHSEFQHSWSDDGTSIAYTVAGPGTFLLYVDGEPVTEAGGAIYAIQWSDNGSAIQFKVSPDYDRSFVLVDGQLHEGAIFGNRLAVVGSVAIEIFEVPSN